MKSPFGGGGDAHRVGIITARLRLIVVLQTALGVKAELNGGDGLNSLNTLQNLSCASENIG